MQGRRNPSVLKRQHDLDEACNTCSAKQMPDVRLDRACRAILLGLGEFPIYLCGGLHLNGIPQQRTGSMGFQTGDGVRIHAASLQCLPDHRLLPLKVRNRQSHGVSVIVHRGTEDHAENLIPLFHSFLIRFEQDNSCALAQHEPLRASVEHMGTIFVGQCPGLAESDMDKGIKEQLHPAGQGHVAFAGPNMLTCLVDGHKG